LKKKGGEVSMLGESPYTVNIIIVIMSFVLMENVKPLKSHNINASIIGNNGHWFKRHVVLIVLLVSAFMN